MNTSSDNEQESQEVLLTSNIHNGNKFGLIPIAHSVKAKETYESVKRAFQLISYQHKWIVCVDLKMVCFLLGQQLAYTKYPRFLCLWDSRTKSEHLERKDWPNRCNMVIEQNNIIIKIRKVKNELQMN